MTSKILFNIGAVILFIIGFFLLCYGILDLIGSVSPKADPNWLRNGLVSTALGVILIGCSMGLMFAATSRQELQPSQQVTLTVDLPGKTEISQFSCKKCGGALKPENVKTVGTVPMVECPFCGTTYQLTEEPTW